MKNKEFEKIGINLSEAEINYFEKFSSIFLEYNSKINLISKNDAELFFEKHIYDSLAFNLFYKKYCTNKKYKLLDIGTGGGFPCFPVSIKYKNINTVAVDSINKKINTIKAISSELGIKNMEAICSRIENMDIKLRESFDIVTTRALAKLNVILEYAIPYLKTGGYFVAYKSKKADEEIKEAQNALKELSSKIIDKIEYSLPLDEENKRFLIIVKKINKTKSIYPRSNGLVKKNPL